MIPNRIEIKFIFFKRKPFISYHKNPNKPELYINFLWFFIGIIL